MEFYAKAVWWSWVFCISGAPKGGPEGTYMRSLAAPFYVRYGRLCLSFLVIFPNKFSRLCLWVCDQYIMGALTLRVCTFPTLVSHAYDSQFLQTSSVYVGHKGRSMNKLTHGLSQKNNLLSFFSFGNSRVLSSFTSVARRRTASSLFLKT